MKPIEQAREKQGSGKYKRMRAEIRTLIDAEGPKTYDEIADALDEGRSSVYAALRPLRVSKRFVVVETRATEAGGHANAYAFREPFVGPEGTFTPDEQEAILHAVRTVYGETSADALEGRLSLHVRVLQAIERAIRNQDADELVDAIDEGQEQVQRHRTDTPD